MTPGLALAASEHIKQIASVSPKGGERIRTLKRICWSNLQLSSSPQPLVSSCLKADTPPTPLPSLISLLRSCPSTCLACFQDSSHCFIVPLASSSSCRSRASSAAPGPDRNAGEVLGEKLPEAKCSHMLLFIPFKPVSQGNREGYVTGAGNSPISSLPL